MCCTVVARRKSGQVALPATNRVCQAVASAVIEQSFLDIASVQFAAFIVAKAA